MTDTSGQQRRRPPRRKGTIGGGNPLLDDVEHTDPVSPLAGAAWTVDATGDPTAEQKPPGGREEQPIAVLDARSLPVPQDTGEVSGPLSVGERSDLVVCEQAIDTLRVAFWAAGRALQVIRDGRLYREVYSSFDEYCEERWGIQRSYAHKLIRAWPLAERLEPIAPKTINEGQVRELLPVVARHGEDAAVTVYETIATTDGVKVTASVIKGAVAVLPPDHFDRDEAIEQIRAYLRGEYLTPADRSGDDASVFTVEAGRLHTIAARVARHAREHPDKVREFAAELRTLADQMEQQLH